MYVVYKYDYHRLLRHVTCFNFKGNIASMYNFPLNDVTIIYKRYYLYCTNIVEWKVVNIDVMLLLVCAH